MSKILIDNISEEKGSVFVCPMCKCMFSENVQTVTHPPGQKYLKPYPIYCPKCWHVINVYI